MCPPRALHELANLLRHERERFEDRHGVVPGGVDEFGFASR